MILVDKNIKKLVAEGTLIVKGYNENNVGAISYDLTIDKIIKPSNGAYKIFKVDEYTLNPNEFVIIRTKEKLKIPNNILGRIVEKNSLIRTGLVVSGPHYQPGHETYCFLKVYNTSYDKFIIKSNKKIAQIIFEELKEIPELSYNENINASFNNEIHYRGYGKYKKEYEKKIKKLKTIQNNIDNKESKIYENVLTFMGIFISIFSLISINFQEVIIRELPLRNLIIIDLSLGFIITLFMGLILIFIKNKDKKFFGIMFIIVFLLISIANIIALVILKI